MSWLQGRVGAAITLAACLAAGAATFRFGWIPLAVLAAALVTGWWCVRVTPTVALAAVTLCVAPPGVLGESSAWLSLAALAATTLVVLTTQQETSVRPLLIALLVIEGGVLAIFGNSRSYLAVGVLYFAAAWLLVELARRPTLSQKVLAAVFALVAVECISALVSSVTGFHKLTGLTLKYRHVVLYAPLTLATEKANTGGWWQDTPRFTVFAGEPGLAGILLLLAIAYFLTFERGRRRSFLVATSLAGCVLTQSTGVAFGLIAFAVIAGTVAVARRLTVLPALVVTATSVPLLLYVGNRLLAAKARANPLSVSQRGLFGSGYQGDISMSATLHHHAYLVLPVLVLLAYLLWIGIRHPVTAGVVAAIGLLGFYAEPLHYHPATWILLTLVVMLVLHAPTPSAVRLSRGN